MVGPERGRYRTKVERLQADARWAEEAGLATVWIPQIPDEFDALTAAALGVPVSFFAALLVSFFSKAPEQSALEAIDEMRVPAGETLQSRMLRLAARAKPVGKA